MTDFFDNSDTDNCPILSCEVVGADCATASSKVKYSPSSDIMIVMESEKSGYSENQCIKCSNKI